MPNKMPQAQMPAAQAQMPPILAQPGHQADLQLINTLVEQLAAVQTSNRLELDQMMKEIKELRLEKTISGELSRYWTRLLAKGTTTNPSD